METEKNRAIVGDHAMVTSGRPEATRIGVDILERGGNAVDAAVAVGFAMGVAEPGTSGIGGGGFMTIKCGDNPEPVFIDFREFAPEKASPEMWRFNNEGKILDRENIIGARAVSVPGETAGLIEALDRYGTMSRNEVIAPSVTLAEEGIEVSPLLHNLMEIYAPYLERCGEAKRIYLNNGAGFQVGDILRNPELAESLDKIAADGRAAFYEGEIAESIIATIEERGGVLTRKDLKDYRVDIKEPVYGNYRGYTIISSPPPSSGGAHIIQALNILENFDVREMDVNSPAYLHLFSEVFKLVYHDRAKFMADTDFVEVPVKGLRSKEYAEKLAGRIDMSKSSNPAHFDPWNYEHDETTHYSIGDEAGNLVSVTKTINHFFGSCLVAKGTGILLNNTMADFSTKKYDVNSVDRRKKPLSTMAPSIILKDGYPFAVLGSPGGARIINVVAQVISKLIDHEMNVQEAISSPRITQNTSNIIYYEDRMQPGAIGSLVDMGHELVQRLPWDKKMGGVQAIRYLANSTIEGGADPRRDGMALGI